MDIGANIRRFRTLKGVSQQFLADALEISQRQLSRIENNQTEIKFSCVEKIRRILNINLYQLIDHVENTALEINQKSVSENNSISTAHLMNQYEKYIAHLEKEVVFLRKLLEQKNS